jgi:hypothetical protein
MLYWVHGNDAGQCFYSTFGLFCLVSLFGGVRE